MMDALQATDKATDALKTQSYPGTEEGIGYALIAIARHLETIEQGIGYSLVNMNRYLEAILDELRVMNAHNTGAFELETDEEQPFRVRDPWETQDPPDDLPY